LSPRQTLPARRHGRAFLGASLLAAALMLMVGSVAAADASVSIQDFAFQPASVTVRVGDTVTWTNRDDVVHTVQWSGGSESPDLENGESYSRTFTSTGVFSYICGPHPFMTGSVRVLPAAGGTGAGGQPGTDTATPTGPVSPSLLLPALLAVLGGIGLAAARVASRREESETGAR
jgi:plastocyanin